jgi:hypothetical protein
MFVPSPRYFFRAAFGNPKGFGPYSASTPKSVVPSQWRNALEPSSEQRPPMAAAAADLMEAGKAALAALGGAEEDDTSASQHSNR